MAMGENVAWGTPGALYYHWSHTAWLDLATHTHSAMASLRKNSGEQSIAEGEMFESTEKADHRLLMKTFQISPHICHQRRIGSSHPAPQSPLRLQGAKNKIRHYRRNEKTRKRAHAKYTFHLRSGLNLCTCFLRIAQNSHSFSYFIAFAPA